MEHERQRTEGTLTERIVNQCIGHSFDIQSNTLESYVWIFVPLKNKKNHFHKLSRKVVCETDQARKSEMGGATKFFVDALRSTFINQSSVYDSLLMYDHDDGQHHEIGRTEHYLDRGKMFWPPRVEHHTPSAMNYVSFLAP